MEGAIHVVSTDYVDAMGMTLLRGRNFTAADVRNSELVILVNQAFAKRYIDGDPLGVPVSLDLDGGRPCEPTKAVKSACTNRWRVVRILADVRQSGADAPVQPEIFASRVSFFRPCRPLSTSPHERPAILPRWPRTCAPSSRAQARGA